MIDNGEGMPEVVKRQELARDVAAMELVHGDACTVCTARVEVISVDRAGRPRAVAVHHELGCPLADSDVNY